MISQTWAGCHEGSRPFFVRIIKDTLPECTDLTLEQPELLLDFDDTEVGGGGRF